MAGRVSDAGRGNGRAGGVRAAAGACMGRYAVGCSAGAKCCSSGRLAHMVATSGWPAAKARSSHIRTVHAQKVVSSHPREMVQHDLEGSGMACPFNTLFLHLKATQEEDCQPILWKLRALQNLEPGRAGSWEGRSLLLTVRESHVGCRQQVQGHAGT